MSLSLHLLTNRYVFESSPTRHDLGALHVPFDELTQPGQTEARLDAPLGSANCSSAHHHVRSIAWSRSKLAPVPSRTSRSVGGRLGTPPRRRLLWTLCRSHRAEAEISRPSGSS